MQGLQREAQWKFREEKREVPPSERLPDLSLESLMWREGHMLKSLQFQGTVINDMETAVPEAWGSWSNCAFSQEAESDGSLIYCVSLNLHILDMSQD